MGRRKIKIGGIIQRRKLARIAVLAYRHRPDAAAALFRALGDRGVNCPFVVHTVGDDSLDQIVACVNPGDLPAVHEVFRELEERMGAKESVYDRDVGIVSLFGPHFGEEPGIAGEMLSALAAADITILGMSCSISTLSCLVEDRDMDAAVQVLEEIFELP